MRPVILALTTAVAALAAPAPARASGWGWNGRFLLRSPLFDGADPSPYTGPRPPVGSGRIDLMAGAVATTSAAWELGGSLRWSPHVLGWANGDIGFGQRGALELDVRRFVPPHDSRSAGGMWEGGYAGTTVMAELWGRRAPGSFTVGAAHLFVGYRSLIDERTPAWLEVGLGLWGDRTTEPSSQTVPEGGGGMLVRAGVGLAPTIAAPSR